MGGLRMHGGSAWVNMISTYGHSIQEQSAEAVPSSSCPRASPHALMQAPRLTHATPSQHGIWSTPRPPISRPSMPLTFAINTHSVALAGSIGRQAAGGAQEAALVTAIAARAQQGSLLGGERAGSQAPLVTALQLPVTALDAWGIGLGVEVGGA